MTRGVASAGGRRLSCENDVIPRYARNDTNNRPWRGEPQARRLCHWDGDNGGGASALTLLRQGFVGREYRRN
jgi:hypothetical protein